MTGYCSVTHHEGTDLDKVVLSDAVVYLLFKAAFLGVNNVAHSSQT